MANTVVSADGLPGGLTLTLELYTAASDTIANTAGGDTLTEETNRKGYYTATVTEALAGIYFALILDGSSNKIADGWVYIADDTSTYRVMGDTLMEAITSGMTTAGSIGKKLANNLPEGIQKNAVFSNFEFLMVLSSDGRTPKTGLTVTGQRSIDGGAFASVSGTISEVGNGIYQIDLLAADTNGDVITYRFSGTAADDTFVTIKTTT